MKYKSWLKYFLIITLILVIVFLEKFVFDGIILKANETFEYDIYFKNIIMIVFYGSIGLVLGLEYLIQEIKKEGAWTINIPKLVFMGIPSLYFSLVIFIYYSSNLFVRNVIGYHIGSLLTNSTNFISVFQIILGYSIITSFYKKSDNN